MQTTIHSSFLPHLEPEQSLAFYRDETMTTFNTLKKEGLAFGLPSTVLIDENGCLLGAMNGPAEWDSADAKALVGAALGG